MRDPRGGPPPPRSRLAARRLPLFAGAALSLLAGLWSGLGLLGLGVPLPQGGLASQHGPLMALGFLGTLVSLERSVALGRPWGYSAPVLAALGAVAVLAGFVQPGRLLLTAAGGWLVAVYLVLLRRRPGYDTVIEMSGAVAWYVGGMLWTRTGLVTDLVPWLAAFLVLTIAGERLELARVAFLRRGAGTGMLAAAALVGAGAAVSVVHEDAGWRVTGLGMLALAGWLAAHDVARRTVRARGLPRYTAACLLAGYVWLAATGAMWLAWGLPEDGGGGYDAALHALFLGFVVSMVFGHAPVILPAVLRVRLPYHPVLYGPLVLLHAALVVRLLGDLTGGHGTRVLGGVLGEVSLLAFAACAVAASRLVRPAAPGARGRAARPPRSPEPSPTHPDPGMEPS
ncbi:hypothetical protein [Actinorugispora endophytica]|uniref:Uncharacterized protein n=1 Tax=Actinorugispora endophytica TaxID=1605990 RepID=A0A4R6V3A9_9ACTN|nr:hypothetical protein [Actinorugispora endophytica]TDQ53140.1 hypothetical protein EV190_105262 [Actinorugispora endophytica]